MRRKIFVKSAGQTPQLLLMSLTQVASSMHLAAFSHTLPGKSAAKKMYDRHKPSPVTRISASKQLYIRRMWRPCCLSLSRPSLLIWGRFPVTYLGSLPLVVKFGGLLFARFTAVVTVLGRLQCISINYKN